MKNSKLWLLASALLLANFTYAQKADIGNWFIYFGNQKINKKFNWHNEVQYRNYNFIGDMQQLLIRTGIGYNLTANNNNLLLGYGFIRSANYAAGAEIKTGSTEHRIYQQFITRQNFGRVFIQHRYRVEERFLPNDFKLRGRYFLACNVPLNHNTMKAKTLYASVYNEIFLNLQKPVYDRNRLYGAIGYVIDKNFRIETGIMNQAVENSSRNQFQIVVYNNLPLSSRKEG